MSLLLSTSLAFASEQTGTINTGLGAVVIGPPTASPVTGTVFTSTPQNITLTAAGSTSIHYIAGSAPATPNCSTGTSIVSGGTAAITSTNHILKAVSCYPESNISDPVTFTYTFITVAAPTASPGTGASFTTSQSITLSKNGDATSIHYRTDGIAPNCSTGTTYSTPFILSSTTTVKAVSCYPGSNISSTATFIYTKTASTGSSSGSSGGDTVAPTSTTQQTTTTPPPTTPFTDTKNNWAAGYIETLRTNCHVLGYSDASGKLLNIFKPDANISRSELVKILVGCQYTTVPYPTVNPFSDVSKTAWYAPYVAKGKALGWLAGYPDPSKCKTYAVPCFLPENMISRAEATKVILLAKFKDTDVSGGTSTFTDVPADAWYIKYIKFAVLKHFVNGYTENGVLTGTFGPNDNITRGQAAKIIVLVLGL